MKLFTFMVVVLIYSCKAALAAKPIIPSQFWGTWVESREYCGDKGGGSEATAEITGQKIWHPGLMEACAIKVIKNSSKTVFSGKYHCESDGDPVEENITLRLTADGKLTENKSPVLTRCKR